MDVVLISLHFAEELAVVKSDFGEKFDQQLKHLITEFADVTEEPQGLPPHRGHLDHKVKLTSYPVVHSRFSGTRVSRARAAMRTRYLDRIGDRTIVREILNVRVRCMMCMVMWQSSA